ncbi:MAG: protease modulator HflC [Acidobacteria bacterium]|nr:protease modulator HflC [Acidobacteriota bacterium]
MTDHDHHQHHDHHGHNHEAHRHDDGERHEHSPRRRASWWRAGLVALAIVALVRSVFVVPETESAIVTRFGKPVRTIEEPGLRLKWPIDRRLRFDNRVLLYDPAPAEFLTQDKKNLVVDTAVVWRIADPARFLETIGDRSGAEMRLHDVVWAGLAAALGRTELSQLVSTEPKKLRIEKVSAEVRESAVAVSLPQLGVEILEVQLTRLSFPEQNLESVFARMRAERERIAKEYRAQGEEQAMIIRAEADRDRELILAGAYREAEILRGQGDAEAAGIYGDAYRQDPSLYRFLRTLESYESILDDQTTVILSADSELFSLLGGASQ